jgi:hypothetical protein
MRIFNNAVRDLLISKKKRKHLVIKIRINENNNLSLVDNESEIELINESFAQLNNIRLINLEKKNRIKLTLNDDEIAQILDKAVKVKVRTERHRERLFCYVAKFNTYVLILKND